MKLALKVFVPFLFIGIFGYWLVNHSGYFPYSHNPMQYMPNMHRSPALRPQEESSLFENGSGARMPPVGSISRDAWIYPYSKEVRAEEVERKSNPFPKTTDVVLRGQQMYDTHCIVCHGPKGQGNGFVVPAFPKPPSLHTDRVRGLADSQIFHIITVGQNTMSSYAPQVRVQDRWAIVHYIRVLQLAENPSETDLKAFDEFVGSVTEEQNP